MISLQTNIDSLMAQRNLAADNTFQSKTIQQLTSGYRINSSGDDAAGLAIANGYQSSVAELNQGVRNANDGVSQLQIVDGGLSNISTILNRLKTLATQSASATFTGDRSTLNQEYSGLLKEIDRQAGNINLNAGGTFNTLLSVFIGGGGANQTNSTVSVDLSGTQNAVDATSLGISTTNVLNGGAGFTANAQRLDAPGALFLAGSGSENFSFNLYGTGGAQTITATVSGGTNGVDEAGVLSQLNSQLNQYGVTASTDANGLLQFSGSTAFNVTDTAGAGATLITPSTTNNVTSNTANYNVAGQTAYGAITGADTENLVVQAGGKSINVNLTAANGGTAASAVAAINAQTAKYGVYAILNSAGTGIDFQSSDSFSVNSTESTAGDGTFAASGFTAATAPASGSTNNATSAITAIDSAIKVLGLVQGSVGAGENKLTYAISLAQSQISSFSSAESQIRDADVAAQAANLTKSQVLTQTSVAALAQANSEPQAILKLLQ